MTHKQRRKRRERIARAVKRGTPPAKVAQQHGVTVTTVDNACREHGVGVMTRQERRKRREKIARDVQRGTAVALVAERHGVSFASVHIACRKHGVRVPDPRLEFSKTKAGALAILADLRNRDNESVRDIARKLNVTHQRVYQVYKEAKALGLDPGPPTKQSRRNAG